MTGPTWLRLAGIGTLLFGFPILWFSKLLGAGLFGLGLWLLFKPSSGEVDSAPPRAKAGAIPPWEKGS